MGVTIDATLGSLLVARDDGGLRENGEGVMGDATLESCPHGWSRCQHEGELWLKASRCGGRDAVGEES